MSALSLTPLPAPSRAPQQGECSPHAASPRAGTDTGLRHFVELRGDALLVFKSRDLPLAIRCLHGRVWVTQEGDTRDRVLHPGHTHAFSNCGKAVITAFDCARIEILNKNSF